MKTTVLHNKHVALGAKMAEFAGFDMPIQYSGIVNEHMAVRKAAGVFDVSHMGNFFLEGPEVVHFLQKMLTLDMGAVKTGQAVYTLLCYENGGAVDDLILYAVRPGYYMLIVNAANVEKDLNWLLEHKREKCTLVNRSDDLAILAVQGPNAPAVIDAASGGRFSALKPFSVTEGFSIAGQNAIVARTGYTGEDGCEIIVENSGAAAVWDYLLEKGVKPAGLGARDTLRLEMGYTLYGHEITAETNVLEAGLGWIVKLDKKDDFIGKRALVDSKRAGLKRRMAGLLASDKGIPRAGCDVFKGGDVVGAVTSGGHSPVLGKGIALALVDSKSAELGQALEVDVRGRRLPVAVVRRKFI
jgi:aminomethyltransferase